MNDFKGNARFVEGDTVWISPNANAGVLADDEAMVLEDLGTGYIVIQEDELEPSDGLGWFVSDVEVESLEPALQAVAIA
jgi:hypothetical protein